MLEPAQLLALVQPGIAVEHAAPVLFDAQRNVEAVQPDPGNQDSRDWNECDHVT